MAKVSPSSSADYYEKFLCQCKDVQDSGSYKDPVSTYLIKLLRSTAEGQWSLVSDNLTKTTKTINDDKEKAKKIAEDIAKISREPNEPASIITTLQKYLRPSPAASPASGVAGTSSAKPSPSAGATPQVGGYARLAAAKGILNVLEDSLGALLSASAPTTSPSTSNSKDAAATSAVNGESSAALTPIPANDKGAAKAAVNAALPGGAADSSKAGRDIVNSVLIAIAAQQQQVDMANAQIAYSEKVVTIYSAEQTALLYEASALAEAKLNLNQLTTVDARSADGIAGLTEALEKQTVPKVTDAARSSASITERKDITALSPTPTSRPAGPPSSAASSYGGSAISGMTGSNKNLKHLATALVAYNTYWTQGRIPFEVMKFDENQALREYGIDQAAKTATNWQKLLQPALDELVAYGQGGIQPATIAQLVFASGIIAAVTVK